MECNLSNISVYYEEYGEGKPIIMIHGYTIDHSMMVGCMEPIFRSIPGFKRIYLDLPGMGRTKGEEWIAGTDKMLEVVLEFIDKVIPGQRYLVAGESYGGYLARGIIYRRAKDVDGLFLLCPAIEAENKERSLPPRIILVKDEALLAGLTKAEAEAFCEMSVVQSPEIFERYKAEILTGLSLFDRSFLDKIYKRYQFSFNIDKLDKKFEKPTLFILGKQDHVVGYKDAWDILDNYPRATFAVLDKGGHNLQLEQVELFEALVKEWLLRVNETVQA